MTFKIGDKVKCTDDNYRSSATVQLILGKVYIVIDVHLDVNLNEQVKLDDGNLCFWLASRFILDKGSTVHYQVNPPSDPITEKKDDIDYMSITKDIIGG